ncbi:MAG: hypothetical protein MI919_05575, partial [Holophagales bacterium]|nr:hypothetical protein [Holophagales bacterium]
QQAVYSLIPESERGPLHLEIGRLMLRAACARPAEGAADGEGGNRGPELGDLGARLFDIVTQLNAGAEHMEDREERLRLAELDLRAGLQAKQASAFEAAFGYLRTGIELLGDDPWRCYELSLALHVEAAEMAYNQGELETMDSLLEPVFENARELQHTIRPYAIRINAFKAQNQLHDAIDLGLEVLAKLGERFPSRPILPLVLADLAKTRWMLLGKDNDHLASLPDMEDPSALAAIRILNDISSPVYWARPQILPFVIFRQVQLSLRHGVAPTSAFSFAAYGLLMCGVLGAMREGYRFGQLTLRLLDRFEAKEWLSQAYTPVYALINHWNEHVHRSLEPLIYSYRVGLETGAMEYACINANIYCIHVFLGGRPLERIETEMEAYSRRMQEYRQETNVFYNEVYRQAALNLLGRSADPVVLDGDAYDRATRMAQSLERQDRTGTFQVHFLELILCYLFHASREAVEHGEAAEPLLDAVVAKFEVPNHAFYLGLAALDRLASGEVSGAEAARLRRHARRSRSRFRKWAKTAPENHLHKLHLLDAEHHRWRGRHDEAGLAYDRAIAAASEQAYLQEEALACERAALHYLGRGAETLAEHFLKRAHQAYREWGAEAKLQHLAERFPRLLVQLGRRRAESVTTAAGDETTSFTDSSILDLGSVMKASTAI